MTNHFIAALNGYAAFHFWSQYNAHVSQQQNIKNRLRNENMQYNAASWDRDGNRPKTVLYQQASIIKQT